MPATSSSFNGQVVHGSFPNTSADRFRRALIGHYIAGEARQVAKYYHPIFRMDGSEVDLGISEGGDLCGRWVDVDGKLLKLKCKPSEIAGVVERATICSGTKAGR